MIPVGGYVLAAGTLESTRLALDSASLFIEPSHPSWARAWEVLTRVWLENNVDAYFGRRLPRLLRQAGLSKVRAGAHAQIAPPGDYRWTRTSPH